MAAYRICHRTTYQYGEPVTMCHNIAHLLPRPSPRHTWRNDALAIAPGPVMLDQRFDSFGNRRTFFAIQEPHRLLEVTARSEVEVQAIAAPHFNCTQPWEQLRQQAAAEARANQLQASQFLFSSPYVTWTDEVRAYAAKSFTSGRPVLDAVLDLTHRIHEDFVYDPNATTVATTIAELMRCRRGVCQDLAHMQIACLRAMQVPARYVSGYLFTSAPAGRQRLVGADASHAWVSMYIPQAGWIDLDPTNNLRPSDKHITLAWGRDYGDVCPLRGVILGGGKQSVQVNVDVALLQSP